MTQNRTQQDNRDDGLPPGISDCKTETAFNADPDERPPGKLVRILYPAAVIVAAILLIAVTIL